MKCQQCAELEKELYKHRSIVNYNLHRVYELKKLKASIAGVVDELKGSLEPDPVIPDDYYYNMGLKEAIRMLEDITSSS